MVKLTCKFPAIQNVSLIVLKHYSLEFNWYRAVTQCTHPVNVFTTKLWITRMWANAQRDGRPAEYRWRHVLNAAKFGSRALLECRAVTLPTRERKTWRTQTEFCTTQNSVTGQQPPKMYI